MTVNQLQQALRDAVRAMEKAHAFVGYEAHVPEVKDGLLYAEVSLRRVMDELLVNGVRCEKASA